MNDKAHIEITRMAIEISEIKLSETQIATLLKYCIQPDYDEKDGVYKNHFYNPATGLNFRGERINALTKFIEHWKKAKDNNGNIKAFEELGRSVHYLEDVCTPVHSYNEDLFDVTMRLEQHTHFEKICDSLVDDFKLENKLETMKYYTHNSLKTICKSCAMKSSVLFKQMDDGKIKMAQIGKKSIENGIQSVAGVLYRFGREVTVWN